MEENDFIILLEGIFNYLPIRTSISEAQYISYLFQVSETLLNSDEEIRTFSILPIHLLFMLSLQYKLLRIANTYKKEYDLAFTIKDISKQNNELLTPKDPYTLSCLRDKEIIKLFKIVGLPNEIIKDVMLLINNRNKNSAHANGGIDRDFGKRLIKYIEVLEKIQGYFQEMNNLLADNWDKEFTKDDDIQGFVEIRLANARVCHEDFIGNELSKYNIFDES